MLIRGLRFFCERSQFGRVISLHAATVPRGGRISVMKSVVFEEIGEDEAADGPAPLVLDTTDAQQLMDELWHCGLRPSEGTGSAGSLAATERHLADMRTVAFKLLNEEQALANQWRERGFPVELKP